MDFRDRGRYPIGMAKDLVALSAEFSLAMAELRAAFLAASAEGRALRVPLPAPLRGALAATKAPWADRARTAAAPYRAKLAAAELSPLGTDEARCAFWINTYNALASLSVAELGVRDMIARQPDFFYRTAFVAAGFRWSLEDIEQGILRANRPSRVWPFRPFGRRDGRSALALREPDFRMHFALDRCDRSSPLLRVYSAEGIREELAAAETDFAAREFRISPETRTIACSRLFARARRDFPGRWLDDPAFAGWHIKLQPYDGRVSPPRLFPARGATDGPPTGGDAARP